MTGAAEAALAVTPIVAGVTGQAVVPVLCFHRDERLAGWARDVMVCSTVNVANMLGSRQTVLTAEQVRDASLALEASLSQALPASHVSSRRSRTGVPPVLPTRARASTPAPTTTRLRKRRARRAEKAAKLVVASLVLGGVLIEPVRDGVTGFVSGFVASTAVDGASTTPEVEPADRRRTQKNVRPRRQQVGGDQSR